MKFKSFCQNFLLLCGAFCFFAFLALKIDAFLARPLYLKSAYPYLQFDAYLGWKPKPDLSIFNNPDGGGDLHTNSKGFRSEEIDSSRPQILLLGDSIAWGYGVSDHQTMSFYIQQRLKNQQIQNLAVPCYGIDQSYLRLKEAIDIANIQNIVLVLYKNDLEDTSTNVREDRRKPLFVMKGNHSEMTEAPISRWNLRNFVSRTWFYNQLIRPRRRLNVLVSRIVGDQYRSQDEAKKICEILLNRIKTIAAEKGAHLTVVISPGENEYLKKSTEYGWFEDYLKKNGVDFIDVLSYLKAHVSADQIHAFYRDNAHYSQKGHQLLADLILPHLNQAQV